MREGRSSVWTAGVGISLVLAGARVVAGPAGAGMQDEW